MYSVREALYENEHLQPESVWEDKIVCLHDSPQVAKDFARQRMTDRLSVYSYTIVLRGRLSFVYNGTRVDYHENDMLIYSPGIEIAVHSVSDDYEGMLLAIDDRVALEMPVLRNMIRTALFPVIEHTEPKLTLTGEQRDLLIGMMQTIRRHIAGESAFQEEALKWAISLVRSKQSGMEASARSITALSRSSCSFQGRYARKASSRVSMASL